MEPKDAQASGKKAVAINKSNSSALQQKCMQNSNAVHAHTQQHDATT
jgi:hypothetical protein